MVYRLEGLPENEALSQMTREVLARASVEQYVKEVRALLAKRVENMGAILQAALTFVQRNYRGVNLFQG